MKKLSRRSFLTRTSAAAAGTLMLPGILKYGNGRDNGKVNIAVIGVGGQGQSNWRECMQENIVALCDVSETAAANGFKTFPNAKRYKDFRVMFDEMANQIDAVLVATPDHVHFAAAMAAMERGKHVLVEKPLAHNIWQLRTLRKAAKKYKVITQMGNQGHATMGIRYVKEWYDAGILGDVKEVFAWFDGPEFTPRGYFLKPDAYPPKEEPIPAGLDWDLWLGPAAVRPYSHFYIPRFWRGWYELGNGELGDWACHTLDAPFWSLDLDMPVSVDSVFKTPNTPDGYVSDQSILKFEFKARGKKPPVTLRWYEGGLKPDNRPEWGMPELPSQGMIMVGSKVSLMTGGRPNDPKLLLPKEDWDAFTKNLPPERIPRVKGGPRAEWLAAIKGEGPEPGSNFEYSARLTEMASLGVLAQRMNTRIEYDEKKMKVTNHKDYDKYIKEPVRKGWSYGEDLW
ncbi:MAG TPA: Gfo/Idh/MocA family oxidoreductase [Bacteroidales bacterium]|jgi:predicted dehydrogenase|nr:Gfo/Idh/MocA family oxidoreductase [Bacteroidales bacterium]OQB62525.1 MAG: putative oxidoreductase YdgJ [Bacteroidetes bacterium ADurb.Bin145]HOU01259.1 Gfo/Idh/MocA family oxidoreductase [Bacteroidales bacterium]HQG63730.1 Gfo/Idh/MocA family oxidoreductase [Bacteroidales bacterium]HQK67138.1 Gfo/Idh/MocA family oxidoreductase [Bacteroidales bacterium]